MSVLGSNETWLRPDPKLRRLRWMEVIFVTVVVAVIAGLIGAGAGSALGAVIAAGMVVAGGAATGWFVQRRVAAWGYCSRDDDLLVRRGVLISRLSVVPYGRMQFVDVTAGPVERSFGLATVKMHTAAAASDARIPGLRRADAAVLRDRLAALGESRAAGL